MEEIIMDIAALSTDMKMSEINTDIGFAVLDRSLEMIGWIRYGLKCL